MDAEQVDRGAEGGSVDAVTESGAAGVTTEAGDLSNEERGERLSALNGLIELMRPAV